MKLIKYYGAVQTVFNTDNILRVKNTSVVESDCGGENVVARTASSVYTFFEDEKSIMICSTKIDDTWDKKSVVDIVRNLVANPRVFKCKDTCFVFENHVDLGPGGPELLHWMLIKNQREDVIFNEYEPELYDALILHFDKMNDVSITVHVFPDGRIVYMCAPGGEDAATENMLSASNKSPTIEEARGEASLIHQIIERIVKN